MNINQLTIAIQNDLALIVGLEQKPIIETMKTILQVADKQSKELQRYDLWNFVCELDHDNKVWTDILVLRVCTLEDAIRECMVISACGSILKDYVERAKS